MAEVSGMSSRQRWTLLLVCTATFMLLLDITVVSVALPSIQRDLNASLPDLQWVIDAYTLVLAVLLLPAATLGDRLGRRRLFLAGLAIFTLGSLACALAPTAVALELFRALQGAGGAVLFATGTPLLRAEFSGAALARALGAFGATIGGATAIGPLAGGVLTDMFGWRSIFVINLPIGVAAFAAGVARLRESRNPAGGRADWPGTALITAALTALVFALIRGNALGWGSPAIVSLFAVAAVTLAGFVAYELHAAAPMADLRLFRRRSFAATGFVAFAISATVIGAITYLSLYVQNTLGYSPVQAGLRFLPLSLVSFAVAPLTGRLIGKVAMRVLLGVAMVAAAAGLASMAHLTATSTWLVLLPGFILAGIGLGITSTGLASAALSAVDPAHAGMAAGLVNTLRQVGTATGVAVLGALYASRVATATLHALAGLPAPPGAAQRLAAAVGSGAGIRVAAAVPPAARAAMTHAAQAGTASGLNDVLLAAAAFAALGAVAGFAYRPGPVRQPPPSPAAGDHGELAARPALALHQAMPSAGPETTAPWPHQDASATRRQQPGSPPAWANGAWLPRTPASAANGQQSQSSDGLRAPHAIAGPGCDQPRLGKRTSMTPFASPVGVVLVHGAYADGSSWSQVIQRLQGAGVAVAAVQNPLTSLADDVAHTRRVLALSEGPVILAGHSFAGTVITEAGTDPRVAGLVYIAARAPDAGEDYAALARKFPEPPANAGLVYADGFGALTEDAFLNDFANGVDPVRARVLYAVQGRVSESLFHERTTAAAWRSKPSWYAISRHDRTTSPELERFLADRMNATTVEIDSGHLSLITHPQEVTQLILDAVQATRRQP